MAARVVITGMGIVSSIGIGISHFWKAALRGQSGISTIQSFGDFSINDYRSRIAGQIPQFQPPDPSEDKLSSRVDRYAQMALMATREAIQDSRLCLESEQAERLGVMAGVGRRRGLRGIRAGVCDPFEADLWARARARTSAGSV
jgi:3-oxoacyl-[acyl-carrier-protein] synthase II